MNTYFKNIDLLNDTSQYYDFGMCDDREGTCQCRGSFITDGLALDFDTCSGSTTGLTSTILWTGATTSDFLLNYITLTGLDNYFVNDPSAFDIDGIKSATGTAYDTKYYALKEFLYDPLDDKYSIYDVWRTVYYAVQIPKTGNTYNTIDTSLAYQMNLNDRFKFHAVSGHNTNIKYDISLLNDGFCTFKLDGGFFQGFYKLYDYPYEVLPNRMVKGWTVDMIIKFPAEHIKSSGCNSNSYVASTDKMIPPDDPEYNIPSGTTGYTTTTGSTGCTLNDIYPNNYGFIFYIGTRSENKFANELTDQEIDGLKAISGLTVTDPRYSIEFATGATNIQTISDLSEIELYHHNPTYPLTSMRRVTTTPAQETLFNLQDDPDSYLSYQTQYPGYYLTNVLSVYNYQQTPGDRSRYDITYLSGGNPANVYGGFKIGYSYGGGTSMTLDSSNSVNSHYYNNPLYTYGREFRTQDGKEYKGYYHYYSDNKPYTGRYVNINTTPLLPYAPYSDVTDNALGFRIRQDGHIGYRYLKMTDPCGCSIINLLGCTSGATALQSGTTGLTSLITTGYTIEEQYSKYPIWNENNSGFTNITIKFERDYSIKDVCDLLGNKFRNGTLTIYVNGRPVLKNKNFEEIIPKELDVQKELQQGVPFNISWGGGTQGLLESVTFGGIDIKDRALLLEQLFAGTFFGGLKTFNFYTRPLDFTEIIHNFEQRKIKYGMSGDFGGREVFITRG